MNKMCNVYGKTYEQIPPKVDPEHVNCCASSIDSDFGPHSHTYLIAFNKNPAKIR